MKHNSLMGAISLGEKDLHLAASSKDIFILLPANQCLKIELDLF